MHARRLGGLSLILLVCAALYMTLGARGGWDFILPFRGAKLAALILVAVAVATATVLFQTITYNQILTPSIMGFDALYILVLTLAVYVLGGQTVARLPQMSQFLLTSTLLLGASLLLFGTLLAQRRQDLMRMILTGVIFGVLFRSLTSFLQRMIDPNEYSVIQVSSYARFSRMETELLGIAALLTIAALAATWAMRHRLDVLALGREAAINLGEHPKRGMLQALVVISVLVSVSTALVGPVAFLGLLVVSLARLITPTARHAVLLPSAALVSAITLVGGQTLLERVFALSTPLSVIVDLVGGAVFLILLLRGSGR
ncbi:MAG: iron chelate uptake ABC transporter family permease subunit [Pseudomonadota bacterium]